MLFTLHPRFDLPQVKLELYLQDFAKSFLLHPIFLSPLCTLQARQQRAYGMRGDLMATYFGRGRKGWVFETWGLFSMSQKSGRLTSAKDSYYTNTRNLDV